MSAQDDEGDWVYVERHQAPSGTQAPPPGRGPLALARDIYGQGQRAVWLLKKLRITLAVAQCIYCLHQDTIPPSTAVVIYAIMRTLTS